MFCPRLPPLPLFRDHTLRILHEVWSLQLLFRLCWFPCNNFMRVSFARVPESPVTHWCELLKDKTIFSGITVWYGTTEEKSLLQVIKTAERIIGSFLPSTDSIYTQCCRTGCPQTSPSTQLKWTQAAIRGMVVPCEHQNSQGRFLQQLLQLLLSHSEISTAEHEGGMDVPLFTLTPPAATYAQGPLNMCNKQHTQY